MIIQKLIEQSRQKIVIIPSILFFSIYVIWGIDLAVRNGLHWTQLIWLCITVGIISLLSIIILVPNTLMIDEIARITAAQKVTKYGIYITIFTAAGVTVGINTDVISLPAAVLIGLVIGYLIEKTSQS